FLIVLFRNVGDHHAGTRACERQRRGAADAARCSGDKGNLARKACMLIRCHVLLLSALLIWRKRSDVSMTRSPADGVSRGSRFRTSRGRSSLTCGPVGSFPVPSSRRSGLEAVPEWRGASWPWLP